MHSIFLERKRVALYFFSTLLLVITLLIPTMFASATTIGTNVSVTGTFTVDGNTTIGSATSNILVITARLAADLDPNANNTIDLGDYDMAWKNFYVSSTAFLDYASSTILEVRTAVYPDTNNGADLGIFGTAWNDIFASGTVYTAGLTIDGNTTIGNATSDTLTVMARLSTDLNPSSNNTRDLGAFGLAYNDLFASGTLYLGSVTSTMIEPWVNNTSDLGAYANAWKDVFASGTAYVSGDIRMDQGKKLYLDNDLEANDYISANALSQVAIYVAGNARFTMTNTANTTGVLIRPSNNNGLDLGTYTRAWKNIYASSTLYLGTNLATSTIISETSAISGQGTCLELTASDGTIMYCSVESSGSTSFTCSTTSCK